MHGAGRESKTRREDPNLASLSHDGRWVRSTWVVEMLDGDMIELLD
jgi:hypothetical protein